MRPATFYLLLAGAACQRSVPPEPQRCLDVAADGSGIVARVGSSALTVDFVLARLQEQGSRASQYYETRARLREFVEDQIRIELLVLAALERGLEKDLDVVQAARTVMVRKLMEAEPRLREALEKRVPEQRLRKYYEAHADEYRQPEKRRVRHIQLLATEEGRSQALSLLEKLKGVPDGVERFPDLAKQHSIDLGTYTSGGELPFMSRDELQEDFGVSFASAAFSTFPTEIAPEPVQSARGWHVLGVVSRRAALVRNYREVRREIRRRLIKDRRAEHFDQYLAEIRQRYPVVFHEKYLATMRARLAKKMKAESK